MQVFNIALVGLLGLQGVSAFEASFHIANMSGKVTIYNNVLGCDANMNDDTTYRIITGVSSPTGCYTFDQDMPGTDCKQYTKGSREAPGGCTTGSLLPKSIMQKNGNGPPCIFYSEKECDGSSQQDTASCVDGTALGVDFASFRCKPGILAFHRTFASPDLSVCPAHQQWIGSVKAGVNDVKPRLKVPLFWRTGLRSASRPVSVFGNNKKTKKPRPEPRKPAAQSIWPRRLRSEAKPALNTYNYYQFSVPESQQTDLAAG
ncbi:hypothetical protein V8F33_011796 [Rhypophila sp. PSN 637]